MLTCTRMQHYSSRPWKQGEVITRSQMIDSKEANAGQDWLLGRGAQTGPPTSITEQRSGGGSHRLLRPFYRWGIIFFCLKSLLLSAEGSFKMFNLAPTFFPAYCCLISSPAAHTFSSPQVLESLTNPWKIVNNVYLLCFSEFYSST